MVINNSFFIVSNIKILCKITKKYLIYQNKKHKGYIFIYVLLTSYSIMPAATDMFKESMFLLIGILTVL